MKKHTYTHTLSLSPSSISHLLSLCLQLASWEQQDFRLSPSPLHFHCFRNQHFFRVFLFPSAIPTLCSFHLHHSLLSGRSERAFVPPRSAGVSEIYAWRARLVRDLGISSQRGPQAAHLSGWSTPPSSRRSPTSRLLPPLCTMREGWKDKLIFICMFKLCITVSRNRPAKETPVHQSFKTDDRWRILEGEMNQPD